MIWIVSQLCKWHDLLWSKLLVRARTRMSVCMGYMVCTVWVRVLNNWLIGWSDQIFCCPFNLCVWYGMLPYLMCVHAGMQLLKMAKTIYHITLKFFNCSVLAEERSGELWRNECDWLWNAERFTSFNCTLGRLSIPDSNKLRLQNPISIISTVSVAGYVMLCCSYSYSSLHSSWFGKPGVLILLCTLN